jgi:hypothetical protein
MPKFFRVWYLSDPPGTLFWLDGCFGQPQRLYQSLVVLPGRFISNYDLVCNQARIITLFPLILLPRPYYYPSEAPRQDFQFLVPTNSKSDLPDGSLIDCQSLNIHNWFLGSECGCIGCWPADKTGK